MIKDDRVMSTMKAGVLIDSVEFNDDFQGFIIEPGMKIGPGCIWNDISEIEHFRL